MFNKIFKISVSPWFGFTWSITFLILWIVLYTFEIKDFYPTAFIGLFGFSLLWMLQLYVGIKHPGIKDLIDD
jgi:hypothetical protein